MKKENNSAHNHNRGSFSGRIGYVLAVAGSAVGLGNIWRFPYLAAKYGGGIFLLIYILLTASFGYVLIMSETALGRMTRKSPVGAFEHFGKTKSFKIGGWLNAVIPMLIVPYYSTIGGWVIKYLVEYFKGNVQAVAEDGYFGNFISDSWQVELWFLVSVFFFLFICFCIFTFSYGILLPAKNTPAGMPGNLISFHQQPAGAYITPEIYYLSSTL